MQIPSTPSNPTILAVQMWNLFTGSEDIDISSLVHPAVGEFDIDQCLQSATSCRDIHMTRHSPELHQLRELREAKSVQCDFRKSVLDLNFSGRSISYLLDCSYGADRSNNLSPGSTVSSATNHNLGKGPDKHNSVTSHQNHIGQKSSKFKDKCGVQLFRSARRVSEKEATQTGQTHFQCKYSGKFVTRLEHERIHTGEKPYKCKYCDKHFRYLHQRTGHERIHTGEKPYECHYCDQHFRSLRQLTGHEIIHTETKLYQCRQCDKYMKTARQLSLH